MPRYTLEQRIGDGGMAEVFRARAEGPEGLAGYHAVKRLLPELRGDVSLQARFIDETRVSQRLQHPHIVAVEGTYVENGVQHLVMELIEGSSAEELVAAGIGGRFLPVSVAAAIVRDVAGALDYAHAQGVLHRDVSACNVLVSTDGRVKLGDFGIAWFKDRLAATEPGSLAGKAAYMSPRRLQGLEATGADDAFALGIVVERLLGAADPRERAGPDGRRLKRVRETLGAAPASFEWMSILEPLSHIRTASPAETGVHVRQVTTPRRLSATRNAGASGASAGAAESAYIHADPDPL
jgi:serine/threonine-protein kinase